MNVIYRTLSLFEIVWAIEYKFKLEDMTGESLHVTGPAFTSISDDIKKCRDLKRLRINNTSIASLPSSIGELKNLEELIIFDNSKLESLPEELFNCSKLTLLNLSNNKLISLSDKIGQLGNLKGLILDSNNLKSLPAGLCRCSKLDELRVRQNELTSLPDEIGNLVNLKIVNLGHNKLKTLPYGMRKLSSTITSFYLNGNEIAVSGTVEKTLGRKELESIFQSRIYFEDCW